MSAVVPWPDTRFPSMVESSTWCPRPSPRTMPQHRPKPARIAFRHGLAEGRNPPRAGPRPIPLPESCHTSLRQRKPRRPHAARRAGNNLGHLGLHESPRLHGMAPDDCHGTGGRCPAEAMRILPKRPDATREGVVRTLCILMDPMPHRSATQIQFSCAVGHRVVVAAQRTGPAGIQARPRFEIRSPTRSGPSPRPGHGARMEPSAHPTRPMGCCAHSPPPQQAAPTGVQSERGPCTGLGRHHRNEPGRCPDPSSIGALTDPTGQKSADSSNLGTVRSEAFIADEMGR